MEVRDGAPGSGALSVAECRRLLGSVLVGRVVFTERALPMVHPVNFVLIGDDVVITTGPGTKFAAADRGDVVAFEADQIDESTRSGWSVLVVGHAGVVRDIDQLVAFAGPDSRPWAPDRTEHVIKVSAEQMTGRRVSFETPSRAR